jgi:Cu(I)/Ag(I) efflux system membrane protein CusA/SilA
MIPMAIPSFGGLLVALITLFVVPVLFSMKEEFSLKSKMSLKDEK